MLESRKRKIREAQAFLKRINAQTPCAECGGFFERLEWHEPNDGHRFRENKRVGKMAASGYSVAAIQAEMDRCVPLVYSVSSKR